MILCLYNVTIDDCVMFYDKPGSESLDPLNKLKWTRRL